MANLLNQNEEVQHLLMGNEAIARGALEAGVNVASGYPGTPSSEIIESLAKLAKEKTCICMWNGPQTKKWRWRSLLRLLFPGSDRCVP